MEITDLEGKVIRVTDLTEAIKRAELFKGYRTEDPDMKGYSERLQAYWEHIFDKLIDLRDNPKGEQIDIHRD